MQRTLSIAVIIPVLREYGRIRTLTASLASEPGVFVVVADGDPDDSDMGGSTLAALAGLDAVERGDCLLVASEPGRAVQMNAGARAALDHGADILLFLHADSELPPGWAGEVRTVMGLGFARCGALGLCYGDEGRTGPVDAAMRRLTGWWAGFRSRLDRRPYGDQAQFFQASLFRELGGYARLPLMEDVEIMARAVALGFPPCILPGRVRTSPRRYRAEGWLRRGGTNLLLRLRYALGADPERLVRHYRPHEAGKHEAGKRCILFFLKWPAEGQAKTRLAADVGTQAALELARAMAEDMLETLDRVDADLVVCFTPREREADFRAWLGADRVYRPQRGPDLGLRMHGAFAAAFDQGYDQAVLLGSDIPEVRADDVRQAFAHLDNGRSCVLGPADDGGYWLVGFDVRGHADEVFRDMDWGGPTVLEQTLRILGRPDGGARNVKLLARRTDVDTLDDLRRVAERGGRGHGRRTLLLAGELLDQ